MKKVRPFIPYFFIAVLAVVFVRMDAPKHPVKMPEGSTIYDTALMMLSEFVHDGQDTNLGFSDIDEVDLAWIDTSRGINLYYMREDSLLRSGMPIDSHLVDLHRRIYPVYVGNSLRSAITFQRTHAGWQPVSFDDSNIIVTALKGLPAGPQQNKDTSIILIEAPFVEVKLVLDHSDTGSSFIPTAELLAVIGKETPLDTAKPNINMEDSLFLSGLKTHVQYRHTHPLIRINPR